MLRFDNESDAKPPPPRLQHPRAGARRRLMGAPPRPRRQVRRGRPHRRVPPPHLPPGAPGFAGLGSAGCLAACMSYRGCENPANAKVIFPDVVSGYSSGYSFLLCIKCPRLFLLYVCVQVHLHIVSFVSFPPSHVDTWERGSVSDCHVMGPPVIIPAASGRGCSYFFTPSLKPTAPRPHLLECIANAGQFVWPDNARAPTPSVIPRSPAVGPNLLMLNSQ